MKLLRRLLPVQTGSDVFGPAVAGLRFVYLTRRQRATPLRCVLLDLWFSARVLFLFVDCWRIALAELFHSTRESIQANSGVPADRPLVLSERIAMFFYYLRHGLQRL